MSHVLPWWTFHPAKNAITHDYDNNEVHSASKGNRGFHGRPMIFKKRDVM